VSGHSDPLPPAALVVVAHPDDETLWLEPWLAPSTRIVVAFPDHPREPAITTARADLRPRFPYGAMEFLDLHSADVVGRSDRRRRALTAYGVELAPNCPPDVQQRYEENYQRLRARLAPILAAAPVVHTHNPWGEYGHEEHVQVCRAVLDVAATTGSSVWAWDGLSPAELAQTSMRLRADYFGRRTDRLPRVARGLDVARYHELKAMYEAAGAWTWAADYEPPAVMSFIELMRDGRELLPPVPPHRAARTAGIVAGHVRRSPAVVRRIVGGGGLRSA
jgi:LmbE family N-acetylglucosaminyl deacetylase